MTKTVYYQKFQGKAYIKCNLLHCQRKSNKNRHFTKLDLINLKTVNTQGEAFINCDITPKEAVLIANALLTGFSSWESKKAEKEYQRKKRR